MNTQSIKIKRRNDLIDLLIPYVVIINKAEIFKLYSGETKFLPLIDGLNCIEVKFLYFKKRVEVHSMSKQTIVVSSFLNRPWLLIFLSLFIIAFISIPFFPNQYFNLFYGIISYVGVGFVSVLIFFLTIGSKSYLKIDFVEES